MIERLNFYDIYGYPLPGVALVGVLWFPLWFAGGYELPAAWSSALVFVIVGYVLGHAIGRISALAFPHGRVTAEPSGGEKRRPPSDYLLDMTDRTISGEVKRALYTAIRNRFDRDVTDLNPPPGGQ